MTTLPFRSIKFLYALALAEEEGIGTAYEYFAKRLVLAPWLAKLPHPQRMLIAGLPEKYGFSLDFLLLANEMAVANVVVIEERPWALDKLARSLAAAQAIGELTRLQPEYLLVPELGSLDERAKDFDLCISCGVLQRLDAAVRRRYVRGLTRLATTVALFAPNADDAGRRDLMGLSLTEIRALIEPPEVLESCDYVDMPPWRAGLERSPAQRKRATSGRPEAFAMRILEQHARLEKFFPLPWRKRRSHIVYAFVSRLIGEVAKG
ncbi:MAG: hypothetical protein ABI925_07725 [Verrucomicrobiota bacterium]